MRYGETHDERYERKKKLSQAPILEQWEKEFAWFPVRLDDGSEIWWEHYLSRNHWYNVEDFYNLSWPGFWHTDKKGLDKPAKPV